MKDNVAEFAIDLSRKDCCYTPGDTLHGRLHLKLSEGSIDITSLKITLLGLGRVNMKGKKSLIYMRKEWTIVSSPTSVYEQERNYDFEDSLPECIPSSFYSSKGHVQYSIIAVLEYKNNGQDFNGEFADCLRNVFFVFIQLEPINHEFCLADCSITMGPTAMKIPID
ncbi:arrestin domain protein [Ancylostoma duodenale]|uniref:Arrestin domain protein n=1 Tax=Ancylostoma duodenale TaxID=51022 RepID=A0A0C2GUC3_9BILA|nr:arrestin domain protein [Ancylostoma duodenale]